MKRRVEVSPRARRDLSDILSWYREHLGASAALKVARTIQSKLRAISDGRAQPKPMTHSSHLRILARKHVLIAREFESRLQIVRIVHGAQDLEAIVAQLDEMRD